ncbi:tetratricopeptide repeat protein [Palleronia sp. LCG004]|uniref:tetratricopeptide repeat protein n=1 Tax=Palleronia sp. LCG004 TaxID=3079304 RepID=UPI0029424524|nr:tetratricopeptide repeat protein [Palleronia sp. LCG004]WOI55697.1 tetratricopeptide repeat protein [Palleronia sp. LCG004]
MSRAAFLFLLLAGCTPSGGTSDGLFAPSGVDRRSEAVDGLLVGHRLMAAGEYELALKAYLRGAAEHGTTPEVLSALGTANLRLGRLGQAETLLRRAVDEDPLFVPAQNNLGVVLMERGEIAEASRVFRAAFAADDGRSDDIRQNLTLALAKLDEQPYADPNEENFALVRRGRGSYLIVGPE